MFVKLKKHLKTIFYTSNEKRTFVPLKTEDLN